MQVSPDRLPGGFRSARDGGSLSTSPLSPVPPNRSARVAVPLGVPGPLLTISAHAGQLAVSPPPAVCPANTDRLGTATSTIGSRASHRHNSWSRNIPARLHPRTSSAHLASFVLSSPEGPPGYQAPPLLTSGRAMTRWAGSSGMPWYSTNSCSERQSLCESGLGGSFF